MREDVCGHQSSTNCIFVAKKYGLANHCAAALCGHYCGPHPRVAHRAGAGRLCSSHVWHTLDCLLRPPRRCLVYGILLLRKNERTGADLQAGKRQRIAHGQDRQWGFAQYEPRIFACVYTTVIASPHHHLITSARSAPHLALHSSRTKLRQARPQASSSAFGARVLTFPVDPKPLVWFVNCLGCVDRACSSLHSIRQFTSRSGTHIKYPAGVQPARSSAALGAALGPAPRARAYRTT